MRRTIRLIEKQEILNPKLFKNQKLIPEVRDHLLAIAQEFLDHFTIEILVDDIDIIGSNAGYNYKSKSDIDLHVVTDFTQYPADVNIIDELFNAKKNNFNNNYDITIKEMEVELYIEDKNHPAETNGRYSIKTDEWLQEPTYIEEPPVNKDLVEEWTDKIEKTIKTKDLGKIDSLIDEIWDLRKLDVKDYGFTGEFNLVFKALRARGLLDKLRKTKMEVTSEELSLK